MKLYFITVILCVELFAYNRASSYEDVFSYLEEKGIILGRDINHDTLYELLQNDKIYLENGQIDLDKLTPFLKPYMTNVDMDIVKADSKEDIVKKYNLNESKPVDKEVLHYIENHESQVQRKTIEKYVKRDDETYIDESMGEEETEEKAWFQETLDSLMDKFKF